MELTKPKFPADNTGITVEFTRYFEAGGLGGTAVIFRIPDSARILSRDPQEFMEWCYNEMMSIARQAQRMWK